LILMVMSYWIPRNMASQS